MITFQADVTRSTKALDNPARFALAGNAIFTLVSKSTGTRFTYRVQVAKDNESLHFVSVLTGPDNTNDYAYLGIIRRGVFFHTKKSRIAWDAPSLKAFDWFWRLAASGAEIKSAEIFHEGRCGRCGRALTVPESIASGFGPECIGKL
jgi:hypothetical protein